MAFKEISMFSSLVMVAILSYSAIECNAESFEPLSNQDLYTTKSYLYKLGEAEMNLMDDLQALNDMKTEYFDRKVEFPAVERARNELLKSQNQWFKYVIQYIAAMNEFDPTINYQTKNRYQNYDDLINYKDNLDGTRANLYNPALNTLPNN